MGDRKIYGRAVATGGFKGDIVGDAGSVGTAELAASAVTAAKVEQDLLRYVDKQITNAQMLLIRATPITILAAPGAGKAIFVHSLYIVSDSAAGGWTESADNLALQFSGGTDILTIECTSLVDSGAITLARVAPAVELALTPVVANEAVELFNNGSGEFGGGDAANTFSVRMWYSIVDTAAFT